MPPPILAIAIFVAVFAIATLRNVHLGILMFPAACAVGVMVAGMPLGDVVGGFPINIMILLAGVTYFFGIAQVNGTIDRLIDAGLTRAGSRPVALPYVFFVLAGAVAAMGSPQAGLVLAPVGMPVSRRSGVDPLVMAIAINAGISAGGLAPTSLFGIVSYRVAREAGIADQPVHHIRRRRWRRISYLLTAAVLIFGLRTTAPTATTDRTAAVVPQRRFERQHIVTLVCMVGLVATVVASAVRGVEPDIGVLALAFGALLALIDPSVGTRRHSIASTGPPCSS